MSALTAVLNDIAREAGRIVREMEAQRIRARAAAEEPVPAALPASVLIDGQPNESLAERDEAVAAADQAPRPVLETEATRRGDVGPRHATSVDREARRPSQARPAWSEPSRRPYGEPYADEPPAYPRSSEHRSSGAMHRAEQIARSVIDHLGISTLIRFFARRGK